MAIVGDAYIEVHARTTGFKKEVETALKAMNVDSAARSAGNRAGKEFVDGFKKSTSVQSLLGDFKKTLSAQSKNNSSAKTAGRAFGKEFVAGFRDSSTKTLFADFRKALIQARVTLAPTSYLTGKALGEKFAEGFRDAAAGNLFDAVERQALNIISNAAQVTGGSRRSLSMFAQEAEQARVSFNRLMRTSYSVGPAISGAVAAISDLVFGLVAMISTVGTAAPSLAILGNGFASLAQGAITAKLAFGGIGAAVQALNKGKQGGAKPDNSAIEAAYRRLAQARQRDADTMASANDKVREAQIALNQAYKEGAEALQQLGFDAEDAALSQDKAAIALERARETLMRAQDLAPESRERRDAELAFREAELNYRKTQDRVNDLADAQDYAAKTGIEGTQQVIDAKNKLYEAEAARVKQERDNAQNILEAQLALQKALAGSNKSVQDINQAMKDLSPAARMFARYISSLKPILKDLRAAAGSQLFGKLISALDNLINTLLPPFTKMLAATGGVLGKFAQKLSAVLGANADAFERIFVKSNVKILENLTTAFADVVQIIIDVLDATAPLAEEFSKFLKDFIQARKVSINVQNNFGLLEKKFNRAADAAKTIFGALKKLYDGFKAFGRIASDSGLELWDSLGKTGEALERFSIKGARTGELQTKFEAIAENTKSIGTFLNEIVKALFDMAGSEGVKIFFDTIKPIPGILAEMASTLTAGNIAKSMGDFLVTISKIVAAFADTGSISNFFTILNKVAGVFLNIVESKVGGAILMTLAAIKGVTIALGTLFAVSKFGFKVMAGNILLVNGALIKTIASMEAAGVAAGLMSLRINSAAAAGGGKLGLGALIGSMFGGAKVTTMKQGFKQMTSGFKALGTSLTKAVPLLGKFARFIPVIGWIVSGLILLYETSETFRKSVSDAFNGPLGIITQFKEAIKDVSNAFSDLSDAWGDATKKGSFLGDALEGLGWVVGELILKPLGLLLSLIIRIIGWIVTFAIKIVELIVKFDGLKVVVAALLLLFGGPVGLIAVGALLVGALVQWVRGLDDTTEATKKLTPRQKYINELTKKSIEAMGEAANKAYKLDHAYGGLAGAQEMVTNAMLDTYNAAFKMANEFLTAYDNAKKLKDAQHTLKDSLKEAKGNTDLQTDALVEYGRQVQESGAAVLAAGGTQEDVLKIVKDGRQTFLDSAKDFGYGAEQAEKLAKNLGLTPEVIRKKFEVSGLQDIQTLIDKARELEKVVNRGGLEVNGQFIRGGGFFAKEAKQQLTVTKAQILDALTLKFGKGQKKTDPMYVEVVNGQAKGGPVRGGQTYLVGENGPEIFKSDASGTIIPNDKIGAAGAGMTVNVYPSQGMDETELAYSVSRKVAWTLRRGA